MGKKHLSVSEYLERDQQILKEWQIKGLTMREIAEKYDITAGRIQQIIDRERYRHAITEVPVCILDTLCERLEAQYSHMIENYTEQNTSIRRPFMHTLRYLHNKKWMETNNGESWFAWAKANPIDICISPEDWIRWIRQASTKELMSIRGIGVKKASILLAIRDDIRRSTKDSLTERFGGAKTLY